ncbi:PepSY domain-containing protein [Metabacillus sp. Hm71]|uniref:PepSY domain-containing protein n=1 Tax=Metabacillus sp. Hm71 TaxID=3450743 RepID=UPI003F41BD2F
MNPKKFIFLFIFLIVLSIIVEVQQIVVDRDKKMLTSAEIKKSIQTKYLGDIKDIKLNKIAENKMYVIDLHGQNRVYSLKVDAYSGEILYLNQMEQVASENSNKEIGSFSSVEKEDGKIVKKNTYVAGVSSECTGKGMKVKKT